MKHGSRTYRATPPTQFTRDASTVALWHLDEVGCSIAHDASGNGFDFTLYGGFSWVTGVGSDLGNYSNSTCSIEQGWINEARLAQRRYPVRLP